MTNLAAIAPVPAPDRRCRPDGRGCVNPSRPITNRKNRTRTVDSTPVPPGDSLPVRMRRGDRRRMGNAAAGQECGMSVAGSELVALRRHADEIPERPGLRRRVRRYKGRGSFRVSHYGER